MQGRREGGASELFGRCGPARHPADMGVSEFRDWLSCEVSREMRVSRVFEGQLRVLGLRRRNSEVLDALVAAAIGARRACEGSGVSAALSALQRDVERLRTKRDGLVDFLRKKGQEGRLALKVGAATAKLAECEEELRVKEEELERVVRGSVELDAFEGAKEALQRALEETGLAEAKREVAGLKETTKHNSRHSGRKMEDVVGERWREIFPEIVAMQGPPGHAELVALHNVMLGAHSTEFDVVVVRPVVADTLVLPAESAGAAAPVIVEEVLAVIEVKRNASDIGLSMVTHMASLQWLTGQRDLYDPAQWKTKFHPTGHFDRPVVHVEKPSRVSYVFTPASWAHLALRPPMESGLYWATCAGVVSPLPSCGRQALMSHLACDESHVFGLILDPDRQGDARQGDPSVVGSCCGYDFDDPSSTSDDVLTSIQLWLRNRCGPDRERTMARNILKRYLDLGLADSHIAVLYPPHAP